MRTGDYRVRFQVRDEGIVIDKVGHRERFYENE
jgi:mRNA-degrading endonuclease RelE of RelBE toxin-antitoxin system